MTKFGLNADQPNNFLYSPSSLRQINAFVSSLQDKSCLKNDVVLKDSLCGNGVVEDGEDWRPGEECDCGDEKTCRAVEPGNCCDFRTCRLRQRAVCSASNGEWHVGFVNPPISLALSLGQTRMTFDEIMRDLAFTRVNSRALSSTLATSNVIEIQRKFSHTWSAQ